MSSNNSHDTATNCPAQENPKDPTGKIRDASVGVSPLLPPKNDQHKYDYINKK